jgi:hypothetical protein
MMHRPSVILFSRKLALHREKPARERNFIMRVALTPITLFWGTVGGVCYLSEDEVTRSDSSQMSVSMEVCSV